MLTATGSGRALLLALTLSIASIAAITALSCSSSERREPSFGEVERPDLGSLPVCDGEEKLDNGQLAAAEIMLARSGEVYEAKCLGKVEGDDERIRMHIVADIFEGANSSEQESWAWAHKVSGGWEGERYGFVFDLTDQQQQNDTGAAEKTGVAYAATRIAVQNGANASENATKAVARGENDARLLSIEHLEIHALPNTWDPDTKLPGFDIRATVANKDWGDVSYRVDLTILLGDGSEATYSSRPPCMVEPFIARASQSETVSWTACPRDEEPRNISGWDELSALSATARILKACLVLEGDIVGACYEGA